jgi:hypothetical protein
MFNDILTGKASNEPNPGAMPPLAPPPAPTAEQIRQNQIASAAALAQANMRHAAAERSHKLLMGILVAVLMVAGLGFRYAMRRQAREDAARAAGFSSSEAYQYGKDGP